MSPLAKSTFSPMVVITNKVGVRLAVVIAFSHPNAVNIQLWKASRRGDIQAMRTALRGGADLEYRRVNTFWYPTQKTNALHEAAHNNRLSAANLLLKRGSRVDAVTEGTHFTALMLASWQGHCDVVRLLLQEFGANADLKDAGGYTALHWAVEDAPLQVCRLLVEVGKASVNARDNEGHTVLGWALNYHSTREDDKTDILQYLHANGAKH